MKPFYVTQRNCDMHCSVYANFLIISEDIYEVRPLRSKCADGWFLYFLVDQSKSEQSLLCSAVKCATPQ